MPRQTGIIVDNSFVNGMVTEATGLNFPDKAVTDTSDCIFDIDGSVYRRTGFNFEDNHTTKTINKNSKVIKTYLWENVAGNGNVTVVVVQVGGILYFYETTGTGIISTGAQSTTVTLTPVSGAPVVDSIEVQFCDGNGYLIVTHPYIDPIRVSYDISAHTASSTTIDLQIRDLEGDAADPYVVDNRPTATLAGLDVHHKYNLMNQGWNTTNLTAWDTAQTTMPSNADVPWSFKNTADDFDYTNSSISRIAAGNTPAPKGKYIFSVSNIDRNSIVTGANNTTTSFQRPSACAFFSGRLAYAGINYTGFNSKIYFTQIIERVDQYGKAYQQNDPTSEELFDLLPSDGGVISIPEAGTIYKMFTVTGGLCVFAANGVWFITGSTGLGFTATDYAVLKIADVSTISDTSFVNIAGTPAWWNSEGIYMIQAGQNTPQVKSLTYDTFKTFYDQIPVASKRYARGFFDKTDGHIRWLYRSEGTENLDDVYKYDRVLNYNLRTNAFYPWTISDSDVKVHSIISTELVTRPVEILNVVANGGADNVVDGSDQVIAFQASGNDDQQFDKYLVSYPESGSFKFTFAERTDDTYIDWFDRDAEGVNYDSYFITGYKISGDAIREFHPNWISVYSRLLEPVTYQFQGLWDYALSSPDTHRWSTPQIITHQNLNFGNASRRLKVRGHGKVLQFKVSSVEDNPFDLIGWSSMQSANAAP